MDHRALGDRVWKRFNAPRDDILWYYGELVEAFRGRVPPALWDELRRTAAALRARSSGCTSGDSVP